MKTYTIAITGASGSIYGIRLMEYLMREGHRVYLTITKEGFSIIKDEVGYNWCGSEERVARKIKKDTEIKEGELLFFCEDNLHAPISSGSVKVDGMIIIPCSMKTLSGVANGYANNLVERAADVMIKEKNQLIIVPRETPLNAIHLKNMLTLARLGVHIIPAMPGFYHHPKIVDDMIDFIIGKVLDALHIENSLFKRWGN